MQSSLMEHMFPNVRLIRESSMGQGAFVERDGKSSREKSAGEQGCWVPRAAVSLDETPGKSLITEDWI